MTTIRTGWAACAAAIIVCSAGVALAQTAPAPQPAAPKPAAKPAAPRPATAKPAAASQPAPASGKTACVASALGHEFRMQKIGVMVFGNELQTTPVGAWGVDDYANAQVQSVLAGKYAVRRLPPSPALTAGLENSNSGGVVLWGGTAPLVNALRAAAAGGRCDLYIAVARGAAQFGGTNQTVAGLGIVERGTLLGPMTYVHAVFGIAVLDANLTLLRNERAAMAPLLLSGMTPPGLYAMYAKADASAFPATPQAASQSAFLKNTTRDLVGKGIAKTLPGMLPQ